MKKLILFLFFMVTYSFFAQSKFEAGINLGYVNSNLKYKVYGQNVALDAKSNIYVSVPIEYKFHKNFSAFVELAAAGLGGENLLMENGEKSRLHITTYAIPIGFKVYPIEKFALLGGYFIGFVDKVLGKQNGQDVEFNNFSSSNNAFLFGAEYKINQNFVAEIRYNLGQTNLIKNNNEEMKNNFLQIGFGYKFRN